VRLSFKTVGGMFTMFNWGDLFNGSLLQIGLSAADYILLAVCLLIVFGVSLYKYRTEKSVRDTLYRHSTLFYGVMGLLFVVILVFGAYGIGFDASQFIYGDF
jgi:ABC-type arginine transport system permease subunit